ncbi:hypothetical protein CHF27_008640 [Romboutsia maritimum]|uniref:Uncharacterized protein n=1 Tax=Romboutsia maritimum TaxID=2020948 RepID=A0A371IS49_9FIRM|nr:hypothetical protein [Romboutsia maritimum]RDY23307.1 hypothetical protein CHF27_008640 [Romboutsia maritimum]
MNYPTIVMVHKLEGRIRVKISHPVIDIKQAEEFIQGVEGITYIRYNEHIKSMLIKFNPATISSENVIIKIAIFMSEEYGLSKIKFISDCHKNNMPLLSYYSMISILGANIIKFLNPVNQVQDFVNWIATGITVGAIGEHAYHEMSQMGTIDPEVMSVMYLANSIGKGNMVNASLITWITTFGRHILQKSYESFIINIERIQSQCSSESCYDISVVPSIEKEKRIDTFKLFASEIIESQNSRLNGNLRVRQGNLNKGVFCNIK